MIVNYTQLAERRLTSDQDRPVDNTTMEYLSYVREGGVRLHYLISDIMDYTSIERVDCYNQNRPLDLNDIIRDIELSLRDDKENKGEISISNEKLPAIESHYNSLYVILQNVIENGIKYNESEQPEIIITSGEDQDFHYIYVSDNGIGIEEAYQEKVFDMFYRLHNNNVYKGTGLGLAIAKKTIEKMRGDISISSQLNQGTRVTIKLPRKPCEKSLKKLSQAATVMA
jgi:signal transduction histidine kinase